MVGATVLEVTSRSSRLWNWPVAGHQCTDLTILGRTRVQRVTMPCRLTSFDRNWGKEARGGGREGDVRHGKVTKRGEGNRGWFATERVQI